MPDQQMKDLAAEYKKRLEVEAQQKETSLYEQELIKAEGPLLWGKLRSILKDKVSEFNKAMRHDALVWNDAHPHCFEITRSNDGAKLEGTYTQMVSALAIEATPMSMHKHFEIDVRDGVVAFIYVNPKTKGEYINAPEDIAYGLLRDFLSS
jgi:hypothetical protein